MRQLHVYITFLLLFCRVSLPAQSNCNCPEYDSIKKEQKFDNSEVVKDADIERLLASPNLICQSKGYDLLSGNAMDKKLFDSAAFYLQQEERVCKKSGCGDPVLIRCNFKWYYLYYMQGKYKEALEYQFKNIELTKQAHDYYELCFCYLDIARVFGLMGQIPKGMEYCRQAIPYLDQIKDPFLKSEACFNLSHRYLVYTEENSAPGILDTISRYARLAAELGKQSGNKVSVNNGYYQLAGLAFIRKDYRQSLLFNDTSLAFSKSLEDANMINSNYIDMADTYVEMGNLPEARRMADSCLLYANEFKSPVQIADAYGMIARIEAKNGNYKEAFAATTREKEINDSLFSAEKSEAINDLEQKYNKSQNEIKIKDLSKQKQLYLLLSLAGLLALVGSFFFIRQLRLKNRQKILETEQRLNRARMNPHFFFNALTSLQKFALKENDGQAMASNLSKFSNIMRETLESTYKEYVTIEQEMEFLTEYLEVQQIRFPQAFSYEVIAADDLEIDELQIPAMIIQPFVENSIEHGFAGVDHPGNISIRFSRENKELLIAIKDNGKGLLTTVKENQPGGNEHISRASQIIKDRIYLLNIKLKTKAGFSIDNAPGGGVIVKIHLPLLYKENG